ncbi:CBN-SRD-34 protein [Caenorhabditis brenneri]|uniref:CBN-SRD-34 protein n=1 Tax=Caenorhabditis brenneri TaxID=135651 RepID=G0N8U4_CAEBE|nr:CBN-SRD-34 protein [Caenorhabditis brenneri]
MKLNSLKHLFTDKTAAQARKFDLALTIQTLIPAVCVIPIYTLHLFLEHYGIFRFEVSKIKSNISDFQFLPDFEKILYMMLALPTAIDAFIVIITITPYRTAFLSFFLCCEKPPPPVLRRVNNSVATSLF